RRRLPRRDRAGEGREQPVGHHRRDHRMSVRTYLAAAAAAFALLGLSACGEPMLDTVTAATPTAPAPTPPALDDAPPLPLPETGMHRSIIERAYLQTLADEGITISDERALALADQVCD